MDHHSHKFLTEIRYKDLQIAPTGVKPSRIFHRQLRNLYVCRPVGSEQNCGWQRPRTESGIRRTLLGKSLRPSVVGPLRIALSPCRIFCYGHGGYPLYHKVVGNTWSTPYLVWRDFPIRHEPHRVEWSFPKRNHHPPYKSRGCAMTEPAIRPALLAVCAYSVRT